MEKCEERSRGLVIWTCPSPPIILTEVGGGHSKLQGEKEPEAPSADLLQSVMEVRGGVQVRVCANTANFREEREEGQELFIQPPSPPGPGALGWGERLQPHRWAVTCPGDTQPGPGRDLGGHRAAALPALVASVLLSTCMCGPATQGAGRRSEFPGVVVPAEGTVCSPV